MRNLFGLLTERQRTELETAYAAITKALPLAAAHKRELPYAVRDLSRLLTSERSQREQPYWTSPRLLSAYCRYFLPWNLLRMAYVLPGLGLSISPGDKILDLGSGPLTLPIALWLAYPGWRDIPLTIVASDVAPNPLEKGREIFTALAGVDSPWKIEVRRATIDAALRNERGGFALISAGNVLNEIPPPRTGRLEDRIAELARLLASRLAPKGRVFAVEPGTRLGGKLISLLRRTAFAAGMVPESPCPHAGSCPMLVRHSTGWCHFSHSAGGAPLELLELTRAAKLDKRDFSLSCLTLRRAQAGELPQQDDNVDWDDADEDTFDCETDFEEGGDDAAVFQPPVANEAENVRIMSDIIRIPGQEYGSRYACSKHGVALVLDAERLPSGALVRVRFSGPEVKDVKSGAYIAVMETPSPKKPISQAPVRAEKRPASKMRPEDKERSTEGRKRSDTHKPGSFSRPDGARPAGPRPNSSRPARKAGQEHAQDGKARSTSNEKRRNGDAPARRTRKKV